MRNMMRILGAVVVACCCVLSATRAQASLLLYVCDDEACDTAGDVILADNDSADESPIDGYIEKYLDHRIAGWPYMSIRAWSKPYRGAADDPWMFIRFNAVAEDVGVHQVWIYLSDTDFTHVGPVFASFLETGPFAVQTATGYGGTSNAHLDLLNPIGSTFGEGGNSGYERVGLDNNPYSLILSVILLSPGPEPHRVNESMVVLAPEPGSLALLGLGLSAAVAFRRRSRR